MDHPLSVDKYQDVQNFFEQLNNLTFWQALIWEQFGSESMSFNELLHQVKLLVFFKVSK